MALDTLTALEESIAEWLVKETDTAFTGRAADFIALCEAEMSAHLRVPELERRGQADIRDEYETVPPDFAQARTCSLMHPSGRRTELVFKSPDQMIQYIERQGRVGDVPQFYSITGRTIWFQPGPGLNADGSFRKFELIYYSQIKPLTSSEPTNDVLKTYPHVYLYGSLMHAADYISDMGARQRFNDMYDRAMATANREGQKSRWANTPAISMVQ